MNDHLGRLQQALSDAATRKYGARARSRGPRREATLPGEHGSTTHRTWVRLLRRWPPLALVIVALAISATAAAATWRSSIAVLRR
jgi:hypothetical protein